MESWSSLARLEALFETFELANEIGWEFDPVAFLSSSAF
jgi:hypothetical protein